MNTLSQYRKLFETHFSPLVKYACSLVNEKEQAKDIVQQFFIDVWNKYELSEIENFKAFAFYSIKNNSLNFLRDRKKFERSLPEIPVNEPQILENEKDYLKLVLEEAIRSLPGKCRQVFMLSKLEGLTYPEIASVLNVSVNTIERQIGIGLAKLRVSLAPYRQHFIESINEK